MLEQADARAHVLQAVYEIGETFTASLRLQPVLERIIHSAMNLVQADAGSVMLLTSEGDELVVTAAVGPRASIILGERQPASASVAGRALRGGDLLVLEGRLSPSGALSSDRPQDLERSFVVPLRVTGRLLGVLNLNTLSPVENVPAETASLVRLLANQAAMVIEHARLYEDLARKERRLEVFVDKFLRLQAEWGDRPGALNVNEVRLREIISGVMRQTIQEFSAELRRGPDQVPDRLRDTLTERERQVLGLIVEGLINKEIAHRLGMSPNTVKNHVVSIIQKLGVADRTQAAVVAIRQGLLA